MIDRWLENSIAAERAQDKEFDKEWESQWELGPLEDDLMPYEDDLSDDWEE